MELLTFWGEWLPDLLRGFQLALEIPALALAFGVPLGWVVALSVPSRSRVTPAAHVRRIVLIALATIAL